MIRTVPWTMFGVEVRPLTVRQRIQLSDELADRLARQAGEDALVVGMTKQEALRQIAAKREESRVASALVMDAFTPAGAMRILSVACGAANAEQLASLISIDELSMTAVATLGIDIEAHMEASDRGKAEGQRSGSVPATGSDTLT